MKKFDFIIDYSFLNNYDINTLKENLIIPLKKEGIYFDCLYCDKSNLEFLKDTSIIRKKLILKEDILFFLSDIETRKKLFSLSLNSISKENSKSDSIKDFLIILLKSAIESRSSDIHIESLEKTTNIRFRIDGNLKIFYTFHKSFLRVISSYIKMVSKLDITQNRLPLDGSFSMNFENKKIDFRVSTMPTIYGESIVIRVLNNTSMAKDIKNLGFSEYIYKKIKESLCLTSGLILVAGPTGSGKSTTLYSILNELNQENKKIITVEDPVEYKIKYIQQVEINEPLGIDFKTILRNILRQDPDIILIGEIRDKTSLDLALQASLTGHLVFASIHANDTLETITRLKDLEANEYLLCSSLKYIYSQRLVLKVCKECNKKGCSKCNYTGFYGRCTIAEILKVEKEIFSYILDNKNIENYLEKIDFKSMIKDGEDKVKENITTLDEVYKVINV
ncbi:GspE/PulE family protein [Halarcobacter sp.]|uniref:GspE/PulE family protein n=1 Tax=Halarcobacter sp. TaxID=2321133 RepID=UPI002AA632BD|nr:GspE/PulE family protein [Halarcobacter sp.]